MSVIAGAEGRPEDEVTNAVRAARGREIVEGYHDRLHPDGGAVEDYDLSDLLADLMHYAATLVGGPAFEEEVERAREHYEDERYEEATERGYQARSGDAPPAEYDEAQRDAWHAGLRLRLEEEAEERFLDASAAALRGGGGEED